MSTPKVTHFVQLYISSDDPVCNEVAKALMVWGNGRVHTQIQTIPVLAEPENVVRLGIFYTPALVINGTLIAGGIRSPEDLLQFLPK
ncbi:MAG: hypothetical protein AAF490_06545 [Chloroflexota bacterium]